MSMFHELMMRKKTEYLYPVITGSLTESPEGVFSGFSSANYLKLDNVLHETEIVVKFTTSSNITSRQFVMSSARLIEISVWDSYIKTWNFQSSQTVSLFSIQANTTYWVKTKITSTTKTFSISTDGINYGNDITIDDISGTGTNTIRFGTHINNLGYNFSGSIDLNRSYIKLGSTKYNLQAVVGYTVVGSPTITDGVVSGFSSGNYIKLTNVSEIDNQSNLEIKMKLNISSLSSQQDIISCSSYGLLIRLLTNGRLNLYMSSTGSSWDVASNLQSTNVLAIDTDYFIKFIFNGSVYKLQVSTDDINYIDYITVNSSSSIKFNSGSYFGIGAFFNGNSNFFSGSISIKDWYIKKNNKLWFNGQQA